MLCEKALPLLSQYFDGVLDAETAVQVSQHLGQCISCRRELDALSALHDKLHFMNRIEAPNYLHGLVRRRIDEASRNTWKQMLRNDLERRWSRIRTLEGMWYITRAVGTVMASVFFILITSSITPYYIDVNEPVRSINLPPDYYQQVKVNVLRRLGMPVQTQKETRSGPALNDLYLFEFGQKISQTGKDDALSVVAEVDRSGSAKIRDVLVYPSDKNLLNNFNEMITTARYRPASKNGQAVRSHINIVFSKVLVQN